ncbi:Homogentisate 1,2-dioxygenase [Lasiosphaeria ovina]|uniref:homogentisate 1,2-dioxygenase n=1 Tax=Lasiosphaeria ovina TaxID=92902 RepID=A0AAE0JZG4_9PEZI|nr:Homogentisate 1,2-dioxygenase [Lasiosphaeria ovina]
MLVKEPYEGFGEPEPEADPYKYQAGFGNHHVTEAIPGALPRNGTNLPQKSRYGLYAEHLNGTSFISSRESVSNVWMYRQRPAAAHSPLKQVKRLFPIEACFLATNPNVAFTPLAHTWGPVTVPEGKKNITFVQGLNTVGGHGDATLKEGLAVHQYAFNADMHREAFVDNDGDLLLVPQCGSLDIKTELGNLCVKPGVVAVIPAGIRFSVSIIAPDVTGLDNSNDLKEPDLNRPATGYALEVFGSHYELPDLGVLGANGLAHVRDFEYPVAAFDAEAANLSPLAPWEITVKLSGRLFSYSQPHTPFDVVAWHGKYAPFRYELSRFSHLTANTDQLDPTAFCVLRALSKWPGVSLVDFCIFGEKWVVAQDTLRIPYYHRTMATEICGIIEGEYPGSVRPLEAGGLSFEQSYMPHGETYEAHMRATEATQAPVKVSRDYLAFMFHISSHVALTQWATGKHPDIRPERPKLWDNLQSHFLDHIDEINSQLLRAGMPGLEYPQPIPDGVLLSSPSIEKASSTPDNMTVDLV